MNENFTYGIITPLTLSLIVLKLGGVISWSWLWVLSPIWISFIVALILAALLAVIRSKNAPNKK
jgi:Flp pilus assembly protein TadB